MHWNAQVYKHNASTFRATVYCMFYNDKMYCSYLSRKKQVIKTEWLLKSIISNPLRWAMDLPSVSWKPWQQFTVRVWACRIRQSLGWRRWWKVNHCSGLQLPADSKPTASLIATLAFVIIPGDRLLLSAHKFLKAISKMCSNASIITKTHLIQFIYSLLFCKNISASLFPKRNPSHFGIIL